MTRVRLALFILLGPLACTATAQTHEETAGASTQSVRGATATVLNLDVVHNSATAEILNQSDKDITAYAVAIEEVLQDHHVIQSERMEDYGAFLAAKGEVLHPGQTSTQPLQFSPSPSNPLFSVRATVVALVFADKTSEASSPDALGRIVDHRASMALMARTHLEAIKKALATTSEHPGALAGSIVRDSISQQTNSSASVPSAGIDKQLMKTVAQELEDAPNRAAAKGTTEREYLTERLTILQQRAQEEETYSQIRRKP